MDYNNGYEGAGYDAGSQPYLQFVPVASYGTATQKYPTAENEFLQGQLL